MPPLSRRREEDPVSLFGRLEQLFAEVGTILTSTEVEERLVPALLKATGAMAGSVAVLSGDEIEIFSAQGYAPEVLGHFGRFPVDASLPLAETIRTGEMVAMNDLAAWRERYPELETVAEHPAVSVPVRWGEEVIAAIGLSFDAEQPFDETQLSFLSALGTHVAALLERVKLFERSLESESRHRALTRSMAASLLPPAFPKVPGYSIAARYETGADDIGGDFIDAVPLPRDRWAVVVGDVQGRGHDAAAVGSLARQVLRAGTSAYDNPARLLEHLNEALLAGLSGIDPAGGDEPGVDAPRFVTVVVAVLGGPSPDGGREVTLSLAGHPQPLLGVGSTGEVSPVGTPGGLLGLLPGPALTETKVFLSPGDSLVLFTDGLTERHRRRRFFDEEAVSPILARSLHLDAQGIADAIMDAADDFAGERRDDDTAVVVIQPADR